MISFCYCGRMVEGSDRRILVMRLAECRLLHGLRDPKKFCKVTTAP
jgi:hypothetical protein